MTFAPTRRATTPRQLALALKLARAVGVVLPQDVVEDAAAASEFITAASAACGHQNQDLANVRNRLRGRGMAPPEGRGAPEWKAWLRENYPAASADLFTETVGYWRHMVEGLHFDAASGMRALATLPVDSIAAVATAGTEVLPEKDTPAGRLWALLGAPAPDGRRVEVMAIPLLARGRSIALDAALPFFNPAVFLPASEGNLVPAPVIGERARLERVMRATTIDPAAPAHTRWAELGELLADALGGKVLDGEAAGTGTLLFREARIVEPSTPHAVRAIARVYADVLRAPAAVATLKTLVEGTAAEIVAAGVEGRRFDSRITGLMEAAGDDAFPLDPYQRRAAGAAMALDPDEVQAINGPPGTGKTRTLRAILATRWVNAAAAGREEPPLLLASGPTNRAVTNIIGAFDGIATPNLLAQDGDPAGRWLPVDLPYGWYVPSTRKLAQSLGFAVLAKQSGDTTLQPGGAAAALAGMDRDAARRHWLTQYEAWAGVDREDSLATARAGLNEAVAGNLRMQQRAQALFQAAIAGGNAHTVTTAKVEQAQAIAKDAEAVARIARAELATADQELAGLRAAITKANEVLHAMEAPLPWWTRFATSANRDRLVAERRHRLRDGYAKDQASSLEALSIPHGTYPGAVRHNLEQWVAERESVRLMMAASLTDKESRAEQAAKNAATVKAMWEQGGRVEGTGVLDQDTFILGLVPKATVGQDGEDSSWDSLQAWLDTNYRVQAFHLAARYWEARWLEAGEAPRDRIAALRYWTALAPVVVATFHTLPRVVGGTLSVADLLIVDEAGQASPDMGAAAVALAKRAVIVGDTAQLDPVTTVSGDEEANTFARNKVLIPATHRLAGGSLMRMAQTATAYSDGGQQPGVTLRRHYRSRPSVIGYCNALVYEGQLELARTREGAWLPEMTVLPVPTRSPATSSAGSVRQDEEARAAVAWVEAHRTEIVERCGSLAAGVALLAPFRAQAAALREAALAAWGEEAVTGMVIGTVHALQGAERPVVVFSLTQSDAGNLFVDRVGASLLNVAVSRAQEAFVLACAESLMESSEGADPRAPSAQLLAYAGSVQKVEEQAAA